MDDEQITELCRISNVNIYKVRPPVRVEEHGVVSQRYDVSQWTKDQRDYLFTGQVRLVEVEKLLDLSNDTQCEVDEQLRCKLEILTNDGEVWAHTFYEPLPNMQNTNTVEKVGGRSFVVVIYWGNHKIALGLVMRQFWDEISFSHTIQEFKNQKAKLKIFREKFMSDKSSENSSANVSVEASETDDDNGDDDDEEFGDFVSS